MQLPYSRKRAGVFSEPPLSPHLGPPACNDVAKRGRVSVRARAASSRLPVSVLFLYAHPVLTFLCYRTTRDTSDFARVDAMAVVQIAFFAVAGVWLLSRLGDIAQRLPSVLYTRPVIYLVGYLVLAVCSTLWSTHPSLTLYRSLEACVCLGLVLHAVLVARGMHHALLLLVGYCLIGAVGELVLGVRSGLLGGDSSIVDLLHANVAPAVAAVGMFLCVDLGKRRIFRLGVCLFMFIVIISTSVSTYIAVLLTALISVPFHASIKLRAAVFMTIGAVVVAGLAVGSFAFLTDAVLFRKSPESLRTGSGRLAMWECYRENTVRENVWGGRGYVAGEHQLRESGGYYTNAHNAFVAAFTNLGAVGAVVFLLLGVATIRLAWRLKGPFGAAMLSATVCIWLNSLMMPGLSGRVRPSWLVTAWLCVLVGAACNCAPVAPARTAGEQVV